MAYNVLEKFDCLEVAIKANKDIKKWEWITLTIPKRHIGKWNEFHDLQNFTKDYFNIREKRS